MPTSIWRSTMRHTDHQSFCTASPTLTSVGGGAPMSYPYQLPLSTTLINYPYQLP